MLKIYKKISTNEIILYNNILLLSRNKVFYTKLKINDTFQNRINLIFIHVSFLFIKVKHKNQEKVYKKFFQSMFDLIFDKVELNMREIGYGDVTVNKNMKFLVKTFYNILLNCETYNNKSKNHKIMFLTKYLEQTNITKNSNNDDLLGYFNKYHSFCLDLTSDSVLSGGFNFNYK
jgi:cytochrome b pre-mRNA-processing protein 3